MGLFWLAAEVADEMPHQVLRVLHMDALLRTQPSCRHNDLGVLSTLCLNLRNTRVAEDRLLYARAGQAQLKYNWSNVCMHYFTVDFLEAAARRLQAEGQYHVARKKIPSIDGPVQVKPRRVHIEAAVKSAVKCVMLGTFASTVYLVQQLAGTKLCLRGSQQKSQTCCIVAARAFHHCMSVSSNMQRSATSLGQE